MIGYFRAKLTVLLPYLWVFTALSALFTLSGCAGTSASPELFHYRNETVEAEAELDIVGNLSSFRYCGNGRECTVSFTAPEELCGFGLELSEEGGSVVIGDLRTEAPERLCIIPKIMQSVFTLSPESVTAIETAPHPTDPSVTVTKVTVGDVAVTLSTDGFPIYAEGTVDGIRFKAKLISFKVKESDSPQH